MSNTVTPSLIRRAPRAFASFARKHNELVRATLPVVNIRAGAGLEVVKASGNVLIALKS